MDEVRWGVGRGMGTEGQEHAIAALQVLVQVLPETGREARRYELDVRLKGLFRIVRLHFNT